MLADLLLNSEWASFEKWSQSTAERRARLERITEGLEAPLWKPLAGPQALAYQSQADVVGYGGAGGGGKTDLALGLAVTKHNRSLILRREATQLRAVIDRTRDIIGGKGRFNENTGVWRDLPGGRQIELGGCKDATDVEKYRGRPHDLLAIDEADQFSERMMRFLSGWLRTTIEGQRCQLLLTFNPPNRVEGRWLLIYFGPWVDRTHPRPAMPGELRWYAMVDGNEVECKTCEPFEHKGQLIRPQSRTFFPANVTDNPYLMKTGYDRQLESLPEPLRSQLRYGDFAAGLDDDAYQVIPTRWVEAAMRRWQPTGADGIPLTAFGVDVAHGGGDRTVLSRRYRNWFAPLQKVPGNKTPDGQSAAGLVMTALANPQDRNATVNIDSIGYGASCYDFCKENVPGACAINFSQATIRRDKANVLHFVNLRAWAFWSLREALDPHTGDQLALPPDQELLSELTAARWEMLSTGIKIEKKDDVTERLGRSPDCADAVVLANLQMPIFDAPPPPERRDPGPRSPFHGHPNRPSAAEERGTFGRGGHGPGRFGRTVFHDR